MPKEERAFLYEELLKEKNKTKKLKQELGLLKKKRVSTLENTTDKEILEDLKNINDNKNKLSKCK